MEQLSISTIVTFKLVFWKVKQVLPADSALSTMACQSTRALA